MSVGDDDLRQRPIDSRQRRGEGVQVSVGPHARVDQRRHGAGEQPRVIPGAGHRPRISGLQSDQSR